MATILQERIEPRKEQVMDWSSAVLAGLISGAVFLLVLAVVSPLFTSLNAWVYIRFLASLPMGGTVLAPPATFDGAVLAAALFTHFALSVLFSVAIAFVFHRWGLLVGILGGGLFGAALYGINFYGLNSLFPWIVQMRGADMWIGHILFGAMAGGIYEALEVEEWVEADGEDQ